MESEAIIFSIGRHIDALSGLVNATVGLALVSGWAGLQKTQVVTVLSMRASRRDAFYVLAAAYIGVNLAATITFLRVADLVAMGEAQPQKVATALALHPWVFNPFAYFGPSSFSTLYSSIGFGCLIAIWWIGYSSLTLFRTFRERWALPIYAVFLAVGLSTMMAINHVYAVLFDKIVPMLSLDEQTGVLRTIIPRSVATFSGIGVGMAIFLATQVLAVRRSEIRRTRQKKQESSGISADG